MTDPRTIAAGLTELLTEHGAKIAQCPINKPGRKILQEQSHD